MSQKIISRILNYAAQKEARHLVIASRPDRVAVDYHFPDGRKQSFHLPKKLEEDFLANLRRILMIAPGELTTRQYCKIANKNGRLTFQVTILPDGAGEKIIINIINQTVKPWRLSQLGLSTPDLKILRAISRARTGLFIIASPPGQGKSATLYSLLTLLNDPRLNIYLLSQQLEQEIPGINQLVLTEANWEKAVRHDPDLIVVDDLDEKGMLSHALRAAADGHLVLATMNAENSWEILAAILKIKLPLKLKLDGLKMIITQRLVAWRQPKSKTARDRRRIGLFEILKITPNLKKFILRNEARPAKNFWEKLRELAVAEGFRSWEADRKQKIKEGLLMKI